MCKFLAVVFVVTFFLIKDSESTGSVVCSNSYTGLVSDTGLFHDEYKLRQRTLLSVQACQAWCSEHAECRAVAISPSNWAHIECFQVSKELGSTSRPGWRSSNRKCVDYEPCVECNCKNHDVATDTYSECQEMTRKDCTTPGKGGNYCVWCKPGGQTPMPGGWGGHADKCRKYAAQLRGSCVACDCQNWDATTRTYSNCVQRSRKDCTNYCVLCEADGQTSMPGGWGGHVDECMIYSDLGCMKDNFDFHGADISNVAVKGGLPECLERCANTEGCKAITFKKDSGSNDKRCWLKNKLNGVTPAIKQGYVSTNVPCCLSY